MNGPLRILEGATFCICDEVGDLHGNVEGLFMEDTRFLSSLKLTNLLTDKNVSVVRNTPGGSTVIVKQGEQVRTLRLSGQKVVGNGKRVGSVYRLADGRLVYVTGGKP